MKIKLTRESAISWIDNTFDEIKALLDERDIPYTDAGHIANSPPDSPLLNYSRQIRFDWTKGDVVVGTLHCTDDDVINGAMDIQYPSIETYRFPWDLDDITVFDTPEEFANALETYFSVLKYHHNFGRDEK